MSAADLFILNWAFFSFLIVYSWIFLNNQFFAVGKYKAYPVIALSLCCIFSIYAYCTADYYNYIELIYKVELYNDPLHFEPVYWYILSDLDYDNHYFRVALMIPSFIGLWFIFKKYTDNVGITIAVFILIFLYLFATAIRSSIADVFFFLGVFLFVSHKNIIRFIICLIGIAAGVLLHKAGFMLLAPLLLSTIKINKKSLKYLLILFPIGLIVVRVVVHYVFNTYFIDSSYEEESGYGSGSKLLRDLLTNFLMFLLIGFTLWKNKSFLQETKGINSFLYKFVFFCFYIWLLLSLSGASRYLSSRFLSHTMIAVVMLISQSCIGKKKSYLTVVSVLTLFIMMVSEFGILTLYRDTM